MPSFNSKESAEAFLQKTYADRAAQIKAEEEKAHIEARENRREGRERISLVISSIAIIIAFLSLLLSLYTHSLL